MAPEPDRPRLKKQRTFAAEQIQHQIQSGEELLQFALNATSPDILDDKSQLWSNYTRELLDSLFTNSSIAHEFTGITLGSYSTDPREHISNIAAQHRTRLQRLRSIHMRLALFDESPTGVVTS